MSRFVYRLGKLTVLSTAVIGSVAAFRFNKIVERSTTLWAQNEVTNLPFQNPNVIIIGGGVVGIATAYTCAQKGQTVLVIEPNSAVGQECTSCAAGGMQRSNPVVDAKTWWAVVKSTFLGQGYQFFHIDWLKALTDPFFLRWMITFTTSSLLPQGSEQETKQQEQLKFTQFAVDEMQTFLKHCPMAHATGYNPTGSLSVSYEPTATTKTATSPLKETTTPTSQSNKNPTASKMNVEPNRILQSTEEIIKVEPSLRFQQNPPTSARFEYNSTAASAERYTIELAKACAQHGNVTLLYNTTVQGLSTNLSHDEKPYVSTIHTTAGIIKVAPQTQVVAAAGAWIPRLLATCDLYVPVYPLKGYALSLSAKEILNQSSTTSNLRASDLPSRVVADAFMYTSRLGDEIRITSIGEFSGWSTQPTPSVDVEFRREASRQFPQLAPYLPATKTRCGHRPYVNDGLVLMGRCPHVHNLLVSCGPGSNGWKMAMGSAAVIQGLTAGKSEEDLSKELGFDVSAFGPNNRVVLSPWFARLCRARWNV